MTDSTTSRPSSKLATIGGAGLAATGVAHFVAPDLFRGITEPAFPNNPDQAIRTNGTIETLVGTAIALPRTRKFGVIGLGAYGAYLAINMAKAKLG